MTYPTPHTTSAEQSDINMRLVMFVVFAILAGLAIVGVVVLLLLRPEASATFTAFVITLLALVTTAAGTFYGLKKANEKLEVVRTNTNGTLSNLLQLIENKDIEIAQLRAKVKD